MPARLDALVLCDFAQIREGLLFVQSGGLTRLAAAELPASFACHVATLVYLPPNEAAEGHRVVMRIKHAPTATVTATVNVSIHPTTVPAGLAPGEGRLVPVVVPLANVTFRNEGEHDLQVEVDDHLAGDLSFRIVRRTSPAAAPGAAPDVDPDPPVTPAD
ncbi:MAG: hypothetical protein AAFP84_15135 [Actinomycetota bacterium]